MKPEKIVIVGGGFGGVKTALELLHYSNLEITLISKESDLNYYPTMYHAASGGSKTVASIPLGEIFGGKKIRILIDEAISIDSVKKTVALKSGTKLSYDQAVLALGVITNFFNIEGAQKNTISVKSIDRVEKLKAKLQADLIKHNKPDDNYVLIGGGPTGCEYASALASYVKELMIKTNIKNQKISVVLIEAKPRILSNMPENTSAKIHQRLEELGVKIITNVAIDSASEEGVVVNGKKIKSHTVIWTAGVNNAPFFKKNKFKLNERGRVIVDEYMQAFPDVYVIGDNAATTYSGVVSTALYDGHYVAKAIIKKLNNERVPKYKARRPLYMVPIGRHWVAIVWGKMCFYGKIGWIIRIINDWRGYHQLEPWWKATVRSLATNVSED